MQYTKYAHICIYMLVPVHFKFLYAMQYMHRSQHEPKVTVPLICKYNAFLCVHDMQIVHARCNICIIYPIYAQPTLLMKLRRLRRLPSAAAASGFRVRVLYLRHSTHWQAQGSGPSCPQSGATCLWHSLQ